MSEFIHCSDVFLSLESDDQHLLVKQLDLMSKYEDVLRCRTERFQLR